VQGRAVLRPDCSPMKNPALGGASFVGFGGLEAVKNGVGAVIGDCSRSINRHSQLQGQRSNEIIALGSSTIDVKAEPFSGYSTSIPDRKYKEYHIERS
jgi:hypothetical protein